MELVGKGDGRGEKRQNWGKVMNRAREGYEVNGEEERKRKIGGKEIKMVEIEIKNDRRKVNRVDGGR